MSKLYCYLEPGIPGIAAWLDIHVYVATCEIPGTRDPARAHTVHVSRWRAAGQRAPCGAAEIKPSLGAGPASVRSHWLEPSPPPSPTCPPRWRWWCCPGTPAQRRSRSPAPRPSQKSPLQWRIPRLEVDQFTSLFIQWCDVAVLTLSCCGLCKTTCSSLPMRPTFLRKSTFRDINSIILYLEHRGFSIFISLLWDWAITSNGWGNSGE